MCMENEGHKSVKLLNVKCLTSELKLMLICPINKLYHFVALLPEPWKERRPSATVCVHAAVQRPLGRLGCCPTFFALMSDRDHLTRLTTSVSCLYLAAGGASPAVVFQNTWGKRSS